MTITVLQIIGTICYGNTDDVVQMTERVIVKTKSQNTLSSFKTMCFYY